MPRFLTVDEFTQMFGLAEVSQIAGIGNLNDPAGRTLDVVKIDAALAYAEDILIGYARARYAVIETLTPETTPVLVKGLIGDVARYRLRDKSGGQGQVSDIVKERHDAALSNIKAVATGKFELPIGGEPVNGEAGSTRVDAIIPPSRVSGILHGWHS
ncbi:phage protein Gp36 family protein [Phyllobacterium leguminum]|uniref:Phage gp36-like protein n=1 Tax=Phyllobacterium leguminum TaxID=314237 RepID=A0A318T1B4_9HYPH|nr:phage protein Gp36 family protein [Phyllobacterium leguminum]PYE87507.1 phage gp36-like protein [Phyllobacterium leguminum]